MTAIKSPKKLIEVALPLDDINAASTRENYIYKGNPSAVHKWWAQRPLAAARAILFAQMVNDPGGERGWYPGKLKEQADREREELFEIIRQLVKWENNNNKELLDKANRIIAESWRETCRVNKGQPGFDPEKLPEFLDPFAGGGTLPLEAKRLGLKVNASDLNPIPVMINRALIEVPDIFSGESPVSLSRRSGDQAELYQSWEGAKGIAKDVEYYGGLLVEKAREKIGCLYAQIFIDKPVVERNPHLQGLEGQGLPVIAYMWARTVRSPNPAFGDKEVPLVKSFMLSTKPGGEVYLEPEIKNGNYQFNVVKGKPGPDDSAKNGTKMSRGANFKCLLSGSPMSSEYIKSEARQGRMGAKMLAVAVESPYGRIYVSPTNELEEIAKSCAPTWRPDAKFSGTSQYLGPESVRPAP